MAKGRFTGVMQFVRQWFAEPASDERADSALLRKFADHGDERAFATLVQRYGPLVLRVCRQVLANSDDAEDAFQATFVVLARKAGSIRQGEALPGWLHRVAYHVAIQARGRSAKRQLHEKQVAAMRSEESTVSTADYQDIWPILHDEVNRLPTKYRTPLVLCYLGGKTNEEAASQLNCPVGTVKTRLTQGRDMLRERLSRRGVALAGLLLALGHESTASAAVPAALVETTVRVATTATAAKSAAVAGSSGKVITLADAAMRSMFLGKVKAVAACMLAVGVFGGGLGLWWQQGRAADLHSLARAFQTNRAESAPVTDGRGFRPADDLRSTGDVDVPDDGHPATVTSYPHPSSAQGRLSTASSSRQDAQQQPGPRSRDDIYNEYVEEKQKPAGPEVDPQPEARPASAAPASKDRWPLEWWEAFWLPW